ncbi:MAG: hypothetical protein J7J03_02650 [Methanosarcinales archaeon]|nr:hypothetical protein [Methanosarcinales archaeon]
MKYDYETLNENVHPVITGTLVAPFRNEELTMIVDTGFEGCLLIPYRIYRELGFLKREYPTSEFPFIEAVTGMVTKIRSAPAKLCIGTIALGIDVWTMPDCNEILLGLDVLNKLLLKLNGPERILEILN